jgi:membrane-associated phospholipid phosphatase
VRRRLALLSFALFLALGGLVEGGVLHGLDQHAVSHWMPWLAPHHHALIQVATVFVPETRPTLAGTLVALWTYPASVLPSAILVALAARHLRSWRPVVVWVVANVVDVVFKELFHRPALFFHGVHVTGFDHSLPSGHTMRACVVAASLAAAWRGGRYAWLWAALVPVALVVSGDHTPTDVVAGLLAAGGLLLGM